jgi:hypothetical protein
MQMHNSGLSLKDIRARIEQTYKSSYRFMTPTPHPPHVPAVKK